MLLAILDQAVKREDTWRDKVVWIKQVEILQLSAQSSALSISTNIVIYA
jgi:hypothetical protein